MNNLDRRTDAAIFANINEILTEEELNAVETKKFETYANNCNSENSLIAFLIFRNRSFAIMMLVRNAIKKMNYAKESNAEDVAMFKKSNVNVFVVAFKSIVNKSFNIFSSSTSFFFYMNHIRL